MKKLLVAGLFALCASNANATLFTFSGTSGGGTGLASMDIQVSGNTLTATIINDSPIYLDGSTTEYNAPGITGFGFDLDPSTLGLTSWDLDAFTSDGTAIDIDNQDGTNDWEMKTFLAGVSLDYLPTTGGDIKGALYNPNAIGGLGAAPNYFTTATLTMTFNADPTLVIDSTWIRMQNVGGDGLASLKLDGCVDCTPPPSSPPEGNVPAPATLALMGIGLLGFAATRRRKTV